MTSPALVTTCALAVVAAPAALLAALGITSLAGRRMSEAATGLLMRTALVVALLALVIVAGDRMLRDAASGTLIDLGTWFAAPGYHFHLRLLFDDLSLPFAALTIGLTAVVGVFAERYLHREPGFNRFLVLLALFATGMLITTLAGSIELMYGGWELVGLSSALLIAFFHERPAPVRNGLRTFIIYRGCDAGLLGAAVLIHHWCDTGDFAVLLGSARWPLGVVPLSDVQIAVLALLVLLAAMGKSAQAPFSGWLPRAMEGPTPSSAIFYGALSVHAGAYLLLRMGPLLDRAPQVALLVAVIGLGTALHATAVGRVQTDIKCALAYASLTQVGIIFVEIVLGLRALALVHIVGHACLRSLQFLRAPSLLHDFHQVQNAVGGHVAHAGPRLERWLPRGVQRRLYVWALERAGFDVALDAALVRPFAKMFGWFDSLEQRWVRRIRLSGAVSEEEDRIG